MSNLGIFELLSKRQKKANGQDQDPYQYTELPIPFRIQVIHIWNSSTGDVKKSGANFTRSFWSNIHETLSREIGRFHLGSSGNAGAYNNCVDFILKSKAEQALDIVDYSFRLINSATRGLSAYILKENGITQGADSAIDELNHRFKEHRIGYQFEGEELIRIDSQFIHLETVKPAITLLHEQSFKGAEEEFMKSHEHYRHGRNKEAVAEALKSFESTMKTICTIRKWPYKPGDTASKLVDLMVSNELIPSYLASHYTSLRSTLESGVPVIRNKTSGHGQGDQAIQLPEHFVAYALHLTASSILFLVECHLKKN